MTVLNSNSNLASWVCRIEQLEKQQDIWRKNTIWLKRCFNELKQQFNQLAELSRVESTQEKVLQLSAQLEELQKHFDCSADVIVERKEAIEIDNDEQENHLVEITESIKVEEDEQVSEERIVSAEEFWQRYEEEERNFKEINLTGADLTEDSPC
ncbi:MAG: hypothetical protein AAFV71_02805 [Cyanobacteria bacterium J06633_8]